MDRKPLNYGEIVASYSLDPEWNGPWANFSNADRRQGWKLHISSIPQEAESLIEVVVPVLIEHGADFKIARSESILKKLNEGRLGQTQVGKFMTIYPKSDTECRQLAEELINATQRFHGPKIPTDLHLGNIIYTRYGGINPIIKRNRLGITEKFINGTDDDLRPDDYCIPFEPPESVPNPFEDYTSEKARDNFIGPKGPGDRDMSEENSLFGPGYRLIDVIKPDAKGAVILAIDLTSQENVDRIVLKEGRHHCLSDRYGRDIRTRLRRQHKIHTELASLVPIPESKSYFEVGDNGYLALEYIEGSNIGARDSIPYTARTIPERQTLLKELLATVDAVAQLHEAGFIHRDLTLNNIRISEGGTAYLIDLELAYRIGSEEPPFTRGTFGFMSPQQISNKPPTISDDVFSIGSIFATLFSGLDPKLVLYADETRRKRQLEILTGAPPLLTSIISQCLCTNPNQRPNLENIEIVLRKILDELETQKSNEGQFAANNSGKT